MANTPKRSKKAIKNIDLNDLVSDQRVSNDIYQSAMEEVRKKAHQMQVSKMLAKLFLKDQIDELYRNNDPSSTKHINHIPVACLNINRIGVKFLVTELHRTIPQLAYGLLDNDTNLEIGYIDLFDIENLAEKNKEDIESVFHFTGKYPLAVYALVANKIGVLVTGDSETGFKQEFSEFAVLNNLDQHQDLSMLKDKIGYMF